MRRLRLVDLTNVAGRSSAGQGVEAAEVRSSQRDGDCRKSFAANRLKIDVVAGIFPASLAALLRACDENPCVERALEALGKFISA